MVSLIQYQKNKRLMKYVKVTDLKTFKVGHLWIPPMYFVVDKPTFVIS